MDVGHQEISASHRGNKPAAGPLRASDENKAVMVGLNEARGALLRFGVFTGFPRARTGTALVFRRIIAGARLARVCSLPPWLTPGVPLDRAAD